MPQLDLVFDAIICDLPYGTTACAWDTIIPFEPLWENYKRLVKGNGAVVLFGSQPFTSKLVMSNLEWFKYEWVWRKTNAGDFMTAKLRPRKHHENLLIFSDNKETFNPQMEVGNAYTDKPRKRSNNIANSTMPKLGIVNEGWRYPSSIQKFSNGNNGILHPTQKPIALNAYLIRTYTNPGEIILDNCIGSGTTLLAAQNEGRRAVGIEISEEYCEIAVDRLRQPSFFSIPDKPKPEIAKQEQLL
jgi:site-specific DNA-methyltransferase (adenine-specific)